MISAHSSWLAAHGKLWYDDKRYRLAWVIWPQAFAVGLALWLWVMPSPSSKHAIWAKPVDVAERNNQLQVLRDSAATSQPEMTKLEREAKGGDPVAQFFYATLLDPDLKLSKIVTPDMAKAVDWYERSAAQGNEWAASNLATTYESGSFGRVDFMRACGYARRLGKNGFGGGTRIKGDCYARGLGGTTADLVKAADAYDVAMNKGSSRATAALGYFYENGLGNRTKDPAAALRLYRAAADKGDSLGLHNLGSAYNAGLLGLQRDGSEAARLILRSLDTHYDVSVRSLLTHPELWTPEFWQSLQRRMAERGVYSGPIDGRANSGTLDAVRRIGG
ncbi:tetratricopeptide repeat protein [Frankia sp. RB7]|nr:tetratricopeptide repeat protein [Frankia sp. RB7]